MTPATPVAPVAPAGSITAKLGGELPFTQATLVAAPESLAEVPRLLTLGATPIAVSGDGVVQLRTALGDLFVRPATPLPLNRPLSLQVPPGAPPDQIFLSTASAEAAAEPKWVVAQPSTAAPSQTPITIRAGMTIPGLLFAPAPPAAEAANAAGISLATPADAATVPEPPPAAGAAIRPAPNAAGGQAVAERSAVMPTADESSAPVTSTRDGPPVRSSLLLGGRAPVQGPGPAPQPVRIEILATAADAASPTGSVQPRAVLSGTVTGMTAQNRPIVATSQGLLVLELPAAVGVGEKLTLAITRPPASEGPEITPLEFAAEADWPSLAAAAQSLAVADPAKGNLLRSIVPKPGPELAPALALFLNALRGPQARRWPGEQVLESLRAERLEDIADAVAGDVEWAADHAAQPNAAGWRCYAIPLFDDGQITRLQLAVRGRADEEEASAESGRRERSKRFVVDVTPSRLGRVQLDGLLGTERLDMVLRCRRQLSTKIIAEIKEIFARSLEASGLKGALSVQTGSVDWTSITPRRTGVGVTA